MRDRLQGSTIHAAVLCLREQVFLFTLQAKNMSAIADRQGTPHAEISEDDGLRCVEIPCRCGKGMQDCAQGVKRRGIGGKGGVAGREGERGGEKGSAHESS